MRLSAVVVLGFSLAATAAELDGNAIKLSADEAAKCAAQGGCVVITVEMLRTIVEAAQMCMKRNSV